MTAKSAINKRNTFTILSYDSENFMKVSLALASNGMKRVFLINFPKGYETPKGKVQNLSYSANKKQNRKKKCFNVVFEKIY